MALDEFIFSKFSNFFSGLKKVPVEVRERTVNLNEIKQKLIVLSRALSGNAIDVFSSEREGGYMNNVYFLPDSFSYFSTKRMNEEYYVFRVLYLSVQQKLRLNWNNNEEKSNSESQQKARETAPIVLEKMFREFPKAKELHGQFINEITNTSNENAVPDFSWLYGKWMNSQEEKDSQEKVNSTTNELKEGVVNKPKTVIKAKPVEVVKSLEVDKKQQEDYVLTHNFEKVETADDYNGVWRDFDGDDELQNHKNALDELDMKFVVRVDDDAHSVLQADFLSNATVSESNETEDSGNFLTYNEWDYSKQRYKIDFCKVYPISQIKSNATYYNTTLKKHKSILNNLRKMLVNINNKLNCHNRQLQGDEFDIDAVTDMLTDIKSKRTPSENIYLLNKKTEKDFAILLLLDISLSSDGYVDGNRVIDVEKQVTILFAEILSEFNIEFAIKGFYSKTRNYAGYLNIKDFDESWQQVKNRVGAVEPMGYTRIGAALRHSGNLLDGRKSKKKWVILISDGKPNDYDKYEGKYGISDVKQALRELNSRNIHSYALAIEESAKYYLPQMFGVNNHKVLSSPNELLNALVQLYEKIRK